MFGRRFATRSRTTSNGVGLPRNRRGRIGGLDRCRGGSLSGRRALRRVWCGLGGRRYRRPVAGRRTGGIRARGLLRGRPAGGPNRPGLILTGPLRWCGRLVPGSGGWRRTRPSWSGSRGLGRGGRAGGRAARGGNAASYRWCGRAVRAADGRTFGTGLVGAGPFFGIRSWPVTRWTRGAVRGRAVARRIALTSPDRTLTVHPVDQILDRQRPGVGGRLRLPWPTGPPRAVHFGGLSRGIPLPRGATSGP